MISQGKLFPFGELKEKHIEVYPEINHAASATDKLAGSGYGKWEKEKAKGKGGGDKSYISETGNFGVNYDYVEEMENQHEEDAGRADTEHFKEGGSGGEHGGSHGGGGMGHEGGGMAQGGGSGSGMGMGHGGGGSGMSMGNGGSGMGMSMGNGGSGMGMGMSMGHGGGGMGHGGNGIAGMGWKGGEHSYFGRGGGYGSNGGYEVPFWIQDPNVLFYPTYVYEIFPVESMSYHQKLNSISRMIILLTLVGFLFVRNLRILWIGAVCLLAIFLLQYTQNKRVVVLGGGGIEGFDGKLEDLGVDAPAQAVINAFATDDPSKIGKRAFFDTPKANNPYNNVLVTDIVDNPNKLPAPPAFYPETEKEILDKTKEAIQKMNPTFPNMTEKLFASLDDHFEFEQSARQFYSNPSTTIPNDQGAFAEFCYGEMISCKEGNMFACARDAPRHNLY